MTREVLDPEEELIELEEQEQSLRRDLRDAEMRKLAPKTEFAFEDITDKPDYVTLYRTATGEAERFPSFMKAAQLRKYGPDGKRVFTTNKARVPTYELGNVPCFLHPDAPEHGEIVALGLDFNPCPAAHLKNAYAKRRHAQLKHKQEWAAYQDFKESERDELRRLQAQQQADAFTAIAQQAGLVRGKGKGDGGG